MELCHQILVGVEVSAFTLVSVVPFSKTVVIFIVKLCEFNFIPFYCHYLISLHVYQHLIFKFKYYLCHNPVLNSDYVGVMLRC